MMRAQMMRAQMMGVSMVMNSMMAPVATMATPITMRNMSGWPNGTSAAPPPGAPSAPSASGARRGAYAAAKGGAANVGEASGGSRQLRHGGNKHPALTWMTYDILTSNLRRIEHV